MTELFAKEMHLLLLIGFMLTASSDFFEKYSIFWAGVPKGKRHKAHLGKDLRQCGQQVI